MFKYVCVVFFFFFFFQAEDGIRDVAVTGVQTCALPISLSPTVATILFLLFTVGCIYIFMKSKNEFIRLHILNIFLFIFAFGIINSPRHEHYYGSIYYSLLLVIAFKLFYVQTQKLLRYIV